MGRPILCSTNRHFHEKWKCSFLIQRTRLRVGPKRSADHPTTQWNYWTPRNRNRTTPNGNRCLDPRAQRSKLVLSPDHVFFLIVYYCLKCRNSSFSSFLLLLFSKNYFTNRFLKKIILEMDHFRGASIIVLVPLHRKS